MINETRDIMDFVQTKTSAAEKLNEAKTFLHTLGDEYHLEMLKIKEAEWKFDQILKLFSTTVS